MRLTCPNCGAQYEVPDEVIPESGRDVQCSNCGDTWFQHHPNHEPEPDEVAEEDTGWDAPPDPEAPYENPEEEQDVGTSDEHEEADEVDEAEALYEDAEDEIDAPEDAAPTRRELDPAVADVLREEADRERAARASETMGGLETQPELGLDEGHEETDKRSAEAQARMARLRGEPDTTSADDVDETDLDPGTRRTLLPDIDEINSSLSAESSDPGMVHPGDTDDMSTAATKGGGFRRGFLLMVLLAVIGLLLYMFAPALAQSVPALEGALSAYVQMVNGLRAMVDQLVSG